VSGASGAPAPNASVTLTGVDWPAYSVTTTTDQNGRFAMQDVRPGRFNLWAHSSGEFAVRSIEVAPGASENDVTVATSAGATLTGRLSIDAALSGDDLAALRVVAMPISPPVGAPRQRLQSRVGADGRFEIRGLFGERAFRVDNLPAGWLVTSVVANGNDVTDGTIGFDAPDKPEEIVLKISSRGAEVSGVAADRSDRPLRGGAVIVFSTANARWAYPSRFVRMAAIGSLGEFAVRGLPPGSYLLAVADSLPSNWDSPESLERLRVVATPFSLLAGEKKTLTAHKQIAGS
jgi:hypothetical protein